MEIDSVINAFKKKICGLELEDAQSIINKDLILNLEEDLYEEEMDLNIHGEIKADDQMGIYEASCNIDLVREEITYTDCECYDFFNNMYNREIYLCRHIKALMLKYISMNRKVIKPKVSLEEKFINSLKEEAVLKEKINIEISLAKCNTFNQSYYEAEFKIGGKKLYSLKNIQEFIDAKNKRMPLYYGKEFTYDSNKMYFSEEDEKLIDYIENAVFTDKVIDANIRGYSYNSKLTSKKILRIPTTSIRTFLEIVSHKTIRYKDRLVTIKKEDLPIAFNIKKEENFKIHIDFIDNEALNEKLDAFESFDKIYLVSKKQSKALQPIYKILKKNNTLEFPLEKGNEIFNIVLPKVNKIASEVNIDSSVGNINKQNLRVEFYFDIIKKNISVDVKLIYGNDVLSFANNESKNIIIRDIEKEESILKTLESLNIININNQFIFSGDDENLYNFLTRDYKLLEEYGEVYYSEKFKERKVYSKPNINIGLNKSGNDYLEFTFEIENVNPNEYKDILNAFKENKKFFRLNDNSFISLENEETKNTLELMDMITLDTQRDNSLKLHKNKAVLINDFIEKKKMDYVKGSELVQEISNKLKNIDNLECSIPKIFKGKLRAYQETGFRWFKTLSYLGFGGILADEMGLGKTIQTIAFLSSEMPKQSIIIAPTSLIYNWKKEFEKFAPSLNVAIVHGSKSERAKILNEIYKYDVILTTYGTLKNDEEHYEKIYFHYCIIDEAQNIKNPSSQSSKMVKKIKAKVKFALTGTPIENNLIELWSIFDFIMPGYLYTSGVFKKKFIDKENSMEKLQQHIKPFILRRLKRDVIKELPEKIEKKYYVELNKSQKKIYSSYVLDIKNKMMDENFEGDKITIFSYLTKLRQLCLDPSLVVEGYKGGSGKLEVTIELIKDGIEKGHKILLFSQFTSMLEIISRELNKNKISYFYLDGATKATKRIELVDKFNSEEETKVFLISLKAGGTGLNLTSADIVIHFDPWWNPAIEEQATDRAHRIGQKNVVEVFKIISEGTIEERILNLQDEKKELINNVMSGGYESGNILSGLSKEELVSLFE